MRVLTSPSDWPAGAQRLQQKQDVQSAAGIAAGMLCLLCFSCRLL